MKFSKVIFGFLLLCAVIPKVQAQLVNIESRRMQTDSIRFALTSDLTFNYTDNNETYILQTNANVSLQFKSKDYKKLYFLVGNGTLIRSEEEAFQNSWFVHGRFTRKLDTKWALEGFLQSQYDENLTILYRNLAGAGVRFKFLDSKSTQLYVGNAYMYEIEEVADASQTFYNHRNSTYLSANKNFEQLNLKLTATLYFQPLYANFGNYKTLTQFKSEMPLNKNISLSALLNYFVIRFDDPNVEDDRATTVNLGFTFKL